MKSNPNPNRYIQRQHRSGTQGEGILKRFDSSILHDGYEIVICLRRNWCTSMTVDSSFQNARFKDA
jgi:hypothetical protein